MKRMEEWSTDSNFHVRRLSSEGSRPRLPWAAKLDRFIANPTPVIPILDNLKDDPYRYVQKSVGSCVMDILKDNPHIGMELIERWNEGMIGTERKWIIKHAVRNLAKKQNDWALSIIS